MAKGKVGTLNSSIFTPNYPIVLLGIVSMLRACLGKRD